MRLRSLLAVDACTQVKGQILWEIIVVVNAGVVLAGGQCLAALVLRS